ncbi:MAG: hypothetical protein KJO05_05235 [Bacteroidia bacterium]|nr:hypothetical protein [Bacteroidia bacterium]NNF30979.1 hypothetical protein [Flavobacteriaceae bacterium]MBT8274941.1 hypothetical protein [Bacteroidia bacterium]NNJ82624.1 hypothetical protein [Flavobacteriaceae bacterium]NNK53134.1 hypothetical protein [Flavobacteriaceae bacterium]
MRIRNVLYLLSAFLIFSLLFSSCGKSEEKPAELFEEAQDFSNGFGDKTMLFPKLISAAETEVSSWSVFEDFQNEMKTLNGSTLAELRVKSERLRLHTDSLRKKIPEALATQPIKSRLLVVDSRVNLLDQEINKSPIDSLTLEEHLRELTTATVNFYLQINEKLQKDKIDQEREEDEKKELEKQKRFLDSVYQAELKDQEN